MYMYVCMYMYVMVMQCPKGFWCCIAFIVWASWGYFFHYHTRMVGCAVDHSNMHVNKIALAIYIWLITIWSICTFIFMLMSLLCQAEGTRRYNYIQYDNGRVLGNSKVLENGKCDLSKGRVSSTNANTI